MHITCIGRVPRALRLGPRSGYASDGYDPCAVVCQGLRKRL